MRQPPTESSRARGQVFELLNKTAETREYERASAVKSTAKSSKILPLTELARHLSSTTDVASDISLGRSVRPIFFSFRRPKTI
mmetsp:Transcript_17170/g.47048  ORF Transcript_17170/g.47048 Transcript_17170/m.47048 type:complete len:83 (+) Transcript_17170:60-308(+)